MKNFVISCLLFSFTISLTSCELIGGIFKVGFWAGVIGVLLVIGLIWWIVSRIKK